MSKKFGRRSLLKGASAAALSVPIMGWTSGDKRNTDPIREPVEKANNLVGGDPSDLVINGVNIHYLMETYLNQNSLTATSINGRIGTVGINHFLSVRVAPETEILEFLQDLYNTIQEIEVSVTIGNLRYSGKGILSECSPNIRMNDLMMLDLGIELGRLKVETV